MYNFFFHFPEGNLVNGGVLTHVCVQKNKTKQNKNVSWIKAQSYHSTVWLMYPRSQQDTTQKPPLKTREPNYTQSL